MAISMLNENYLLKYFLVEAFNGVCYIMNHVLLKSLINGTSFELWQDMKPNISYFKVFGCKCFILNTKEQMHRFDFKANEGLFLGY